MKLKNTKRVMGLETEFGLTIYDRKEQSKGNFEACRCFLDSIESEFLSNGARLYNDHSHPEYSTPECSNEKDVVKYDKAGEKTLENIAKKVEREQGGKVVIVKNNTDYQGQSYARHENISISRSVPFEYITRCLTPYLITRQIFTGAGKAGIDIPIEERSIFNRIMPSLGEKTRFGDKKRDVFQLSQRADFFSRLIGSSTVSFRPIINTRDEPLADRKKYRRLHIITPDSNMCEYATWIGIGTLRIITDMIEKKKITEKDLPEIIFPVEAMKEISRDQTLKWQLRTEKGMISAIEIQRYYLETAKKEYGKEESILDEWESTLDLLEKNPESLYGKLDWVTKKAVMVDLFEERGSWLDPEIIHIDEAYHDIREKGIYNILKEEGDITSIVSNEEVERAIDNPPEDTRALLRSILIKEFDGEAIEWDLLLLFLSEPFHKIESNWR